VNSAEIFYNRLTSRTKRAAAKSITAIPTASIPLIGVAVLIADILSAVKLKGALGNIDAQCANSSHADLPSKDGALLSRD
jgi:hypothetical protein